MKPPLPPLSDGSIVVDLYASYDETPYYLRATAKRMPAAAHRRFAMDPEVYARWEAAFYALAAAEAAALANRVDIGKWKP